MYLLALLTYSESPINVSELKIMPVRQCIYALFIFAYCSRGFGLLLPFVCLSVSPHDISKTDAARITKLDTEMFHDCYVKGNRI